MTNLVEDAMCTETILIKKLSMNERIVPQILKEIFNDLDEREVVSIIFLMADENTDFCKLVAQVKENPYTAFIEVTNKNMWAEKFLEGLIIIKNKDVIWKMGFHENEIHYMENSFFPIEHNISLYLNKAMKSLYFLCENLDNNEAIKLVTEVNSKLCKPLDVNPAKLYLEIYILEWLQQKYISIDPDNIDLSNLLKNLKSSGSLLNLPFHFDDWEIRHSFINKNEQDSQIYPQTLDNKGSEYSNSKNSVVNRNSDVMWSTPDHKKLLIIINQINFENTEKFQSRKGSEVDEKTLEETFKGCGFEISNNYRDLTRKQMEKLLESLNSSLYSKYGAIFMCILSHGIPDEIVFADDSLPIATIEKKFCCKKLQYVFKCLILQSCQGSQIGLIDKQLVTDGPTDSINPLFGKHFVCFQATVKDFAAMRHKKEGSWFIQDLCKEIREANKPLEITEFIKNVTDRVTSRSAPFDNRLKVFAQLPSATIRIGTYSYEIPKFQKNFTLSKHL